MRERYEQGYCLDCKAERRLVAGLIVWLVGFYCDECGGYNVVPEIPEKEEYKDWLVRVNRVRPEQLVGR